MTRWTRGASRGLLAFLAIVLVSGAGWAGPHALAAKAPGGIITTVAGGVGGPGPATKVAIAPCTPQSEVSLDVSPCDVTFAGGRLYVTDSGARTLFAFAGSSMIRSIDIATGRLQTPAGDGVTGFGGDRGLATAAELSDPGGVSMDRHGNLVIADTGNNRVRVVAGRSGVFYGIAMTAGRIYTVAGTGAAGTRGDGGPAIKARLFAPSAARIDPAGNLVIAQDGFIGQGRPAPPRLRVVAARTGRFYGMAMKAGDIYTLTPKGPATLAGGHLALRIDHHGNLVMAESYSGRIVVLAVRSGTFYGRRMTAGHLYPLAVGGDPTGVAVDAAGNLVFADGGQGGNLVRVLAVTTGMFYGQHMTAGGVYTIAGGGSGGLGDGAPATSATLSLRHFGAAVAVDSAGNVAVTDPGDGRVRVVAAKTGTFYGQHMTAGDIYTVAGTGDLGFSGDGGPATRAELTAGLLAADPAGDAAIGSSFRVRFVPARSGSYFGLPMAAGRIYTVAGNGTPGVNIGIGGPATQAQIEVMALALDRAGNLVLADGYVERVLVVAGRSGTFYGQQMTAGDIYSVAGTGTGVLCAPFSGDGGPAVQAPLCAPNAVTTDNAGNLLISDSGFSRVRAVAATTGRFYGQQMTAGDIYTIAGDGQEGLKGDGGPATRAHLAICCNGFAALAVDGAGNLMITEIDSVRMVAARTGTFFGQKMTAGDIYTVARIPRDSGLVIYTLTVDSSGNLIFSEVFEGGLVKVLAARSGTFYGRPMTANHQYTVAGGGQPVLGDGGPATAVSLAGIGGLASAGRGLLIAEPGSGRIREVSP